jgi:hypothetical protein
MLGTLEHLVSQVEDKSVLRALHFPPEYSTSRNWRVLECSEKPRDCQARRQEPYHTSYGVSPSSLGWLTVVTPGVLKG